MLHKLVAQMDQQRFENIVVSLTDIGPLGKSLAELNIPVYALNMPHGRPTVRGIRTLIRLLRRERPAVLQTWMHHANLLGTLVRRQARVPYLLWNIRNANQDLRLYQPLTRWILRACARLARWPNVVVINSQTGRTIHTALGFHPRCWAVIPNGFDLDRFSPQESARDSVRRELGLSPDTILIGVVGRYHPMKGHQIFLQAAKHLTAVYPDVHFLLAGQGLVATNPDLNKMIAGHEVARITHFLGERNDMPRLMAALDILANSSATEGFPNVVGEAMSCGVPCVVTDVGDSAILVGDTGIVVPPQDAQALADGWLSLLEAGAPARHQLGQAARRRIEANYSLESIVRQYEELYLSLKGNH